MSIKEEIKEEEGVKTLGVKVRIPSGDEVGKFLSKINGAILRVGWGALVWVAVACLTGFGLAMGCSVFTGAIIPALSGLPMGFGSGGIPG